MPELKEFIKERNFVTDRISTQVRIIGIGLLATTWSLLLGEVNSLRDTILQCRPHFIKIGTIAMIALALDYLQYLFSYLHIQKALSEMEIQGITETNYDYDDIRYKLSKGLFVGKQLVLLTGLLCFIICMFFIMFN